MLCFGTIQLSHIFNILLFSSVVHSCSCLQAHSWPFLIHRPVTLFCSAALWKARQTIYNFMHAKKQKGRASERHTVELGDESFPWRLHKVTKLLWQLQPILSPVHPTTLQTLRVERTSSSVGVKHCVKSKISLIILSKWNVCLCSFSVIPLTVRANYEAEL